ncbi:MAG: ABC transporter ATP-binding protein [Flavobacteriales bacterium]|jgi:lipoprotein-releasing system ATP-binding protein|nr:ABC transporter ATP-binding protein [Flavobacteriales bacterium]MBT6013744.1 ABC transporter ATP-binding protein [Flavobacteriales bacterium]MBT7481434.1 ABC transporter ATP-binding protein [Flavobacteriales bacterium]
MIKANNIHLSFGDLEVLKGVNLHIKEGEFISIIGASGAGKTTLLHILGTLENSNTGSIWINNTDITNLSDKELSIFRNENIGFVFQFHNLLVEFTALENVCLPAFIKGENRKVVKERALELLKLLNIENRSSHKPSELSGGEQQRVAVARALINSPSIILADEPSGNLDSKNAEELHNLLLKLNKELNQTIVVVTHNNKLANITGRKLEIKDGVIEN